MKEYTVDELLQIEEMAKLLTGCICDGKCDACSHKEKTTVDYACIDFVSACKLFDSNFRKVESNEL